MSSNLKWTLAGTVAVLATFLVIWVTTGRLAVVGGQDKNEEQEKAIQAPSRVSVQNGETVVTLDAATQTRLGLRLATLHAKSTRMQLRATATALPVEDLASLRDTYVAAQTKLEKARFNLDVSRKEYERLKSLYQNDQNTSLKTYEAAQAAFLADQADAESADRELALHESVAQQRWGKVIAGWIASGSPNLQRLLEQQDLLIQVTLPPADTTVAPQNALLESSSKRTVNARLLSPFPRLDSRIQGPSFLYLTAAHLGLAPGINLVARLPVGQLIQGVVIPETAVVWWQGKGWIYQQVSAERFVRREVSMEERAENGAIVTTGLSPEDKIVVGGAQMLFSEEFRSEIHRAEEQ